MKRFALILTPLLIFFLQFCNFAESDLRSSKKPGNGAHLTSGQAVPERIAEFGFTSRPPLEFRRWCLLKSDNKPELCEVANYFSEPHLLYGSYLLLKDFSEIARDKKLDFWLEGGTLIAQYRFNAPNPWDDDVDLGVFKSELVKKMPALEKDLLDRGYTLSKGCMADNPEHVGICQIFFTKPRYAAMLQDLAPTMSAERRQQLWEDYTSAEHFNAGLPHLDIFTYVQQHGKITYESSYWVEELKKRDGGIGTFRLAKMLPLQAYEFIDAPVFLPRSPEAYTSAWYKTDDIHKQIMIWGHRKGGTKIPDIFEVPSFINYCKEYLNFVFKRELTFSQKYEDCCRK